MGRFIDAPALVEDLTFMADTGVGASEAASRTGFSDVRALDKWMRRHDQAQLFNRLTRQDYETLTPNMSRRQVSA